MRKAQGARCPILEHLLNSGTTDTDYSESQRLILLTKS